MWNCWHAYVIIMVAHFITVGYLSWATRFGPLKHVIEEMTGFPVLLRVKMKAMIIQLSYLQHLSKHLTVWHWLSWKVNKHLPSPSSLLYPGPLLKRLSVYFQPRAQSHFCSWSAGWSPRNIPSLYLREIQQNTEWNYITLIYGKILVISPPPPPPLISPLGYRPIYLETKIFIRL